MRSRLEVIRPTQAGVIQVNGHGGSLCGFSIFCLSSSSFWGVSYFWQNIRPEINTRRNLSLLGKEAPTLTQDGITFRDLNKNGRLDPYEDPRRPIEERVEDLLKQMTLEEKAGMLFQTMIGMNKDGTILEKTGLFPLPPTSDMIARRLMNHFNML